MVYSLHEDLEIALVVDVGIFAVVVDFDLSRECCAPKGGNLGDVLGRTIDNLGLPASICACPFLSFG